MKRRLLTTLLIALSLSALSTALSMASASTICQQRYQNASSEADFQNLMACELQLHIAQFKADFTQNCSSNGVSDYYCSPNVSAGVTLNLTTPKDAAAPAKVDAIKALPSTVPQDLSKPTITNPFKWF